jgi:hypothetical protein
LKKYVAGNPAFKLYDVDPDTYEIMDARAFIGVPLPSVDHFLSTESNDLR